MSTAVEYAVHWVYQVVLGVKFWDYSRLPMNLQGRVCLPFSLAWGVLTTLAIRYVQPPVSALAAAIPAWFTLVFLVVFTADAMCSARFLWVTHNVEELRITGWSL